MFDCMRKGGEPVMRNDWRKIEGKHDGDHVGFIILVDDLSPSRRSYAVLLMPVSALCTI